ncbi:hypothetical protein PGT21_006848 [Puccinia graminis f. sp. tritici]|uniref:Mitochondrial inner membrane protease subunit 2 n=1 Tax=Puccinia graminis f. sp. tritici TaxID=56615 RepID=A0A5B0QI28_PUCGR|nr:hypothetical protein PGT21_006848 [Puccinia graminis f. sp. tritici]
MKTSHLSWSCLRQPPASLRPHPLHRPPSALLRPGPSEPNVHRSAPDFLASSRSAWTSLLHRRPSSSSSHHQVHPSSSAKASDHQRRFKSFFLSPKAVNLLLWIPVFIVIHEHGVGLVRITGKSMQPTFNPDSSCLKRDVVLVSKFLGDKSSSLRRGDIITFWHPEFPGTLLTKRILGLEGDIIKPAKTQNNIPEGPPLVRVPMGHCWVEGEDPFHSKDSNSFGPIPLGLANAKVAWIVWPISRFGAPNSQSDDQSHRVRRMTVTRH